MTTMRIMVLLSNLGIFSIIYVLPMAIFLRYAFQNKKIKAVLFWLLLLLLYYGADFFVNLFSLWIMTGVPEGVWLLISFLWITPTCVLIFKKRLYLALLVFKVEEGIFAIIALIKYGHLIS